MKYSLFSCDTSTIIHLATDYPFLGYSTWMCQWVKNSIRECKCADLVSDALDFYWVVEHLR